MKNLKIILLGGVKIATLLGLIVIVILLIDAFVFAKYDKNVTKTIWKKIACTCIVILLELIISISLVLENTFPIFNIALIFIQIIKLYMLVEYLERFKKIERQSKDELINKRIEDVVV